MLITYLVVCLRISLVVCFLNYRCAYNYLVMSFDYLVVRINYLVVLEQDLVKLSGVLII